MYVLLLNALIEAARKRGNRTVVTGNDLADILEEAKRSYLERVYRAAKEHRTMTGTLADLAEKASHRGY